MKDVKIGAPGIQPRSKKSIDLNFDEAEDSDDSKNQRRSARRVTIASPNVTPKATGKKPVRISTPGLPTLSAYSSAEEDDEDEGPEGTDYISNLPGHSSGVFSRLNKSLGIGEKQPAIKYPKSVTPSAQGMPRVRTSTPMAKMVNNTSVFGNSSISSATIARRTSSRTGSRIPSSLRVEPPSASSLANFSDENDSENELNALSSHSIASPPSVNLLRYRPRSSGIVRGPKTRSPLANITTQATDYPLHKGGSTWSSFLSSSSASATTSPSSWISISILIVALLFFISIFSFYFYSRITSPTNVHIESSSTYTDKVTEYGDNDDILISNLDIPTCNTGQSQLDRCLKTKSHAKPAVAVIRQVALIFEQQCIKYFCETSDNSLPVSDPSSLTLNSFRSQLVPILTNSPGFLKLARENIDMETSNKDEGVVTLLYVNKAISDSLILLERNPRFKIKVVRDDRLIITHLNIDIKNFPINWPWKCRFTMAVIDAIWVLSVIFVVLFVSFSLYYFINLSKKRRSEEEELKYELIEKSLELLQSPDEPQSMPILHIRDTLISPLDRSDSKNIRVWNEVVKFIEGNESRVKIDSEVIDGETYRTWKWVASQVSNDGSSLKTGNIEWQGQAFNENDAVKSSSSSRKSTIKLLSPGQSDAECAFVAPTCYIKARNLFDIEEVRNSTDPSWQIPIQDAILQKCALRGVDDDHGIQHIYFEGDHSREALVYMKCKNIESATNAYLALHGWWCERKLVSVRFLKEDRYYQRFPEARNCIQSLKPSSED